MQIDTKLIYRKKEKTLCHSSYSLDLNLITAFFSLLLFFSFSFFFLSFFLSFFCKPFLYSEFERVLFFFFF